MFDKKIWQNSIWFLLIGLFGFSSVFNLFNNKDVRYTIKDEKIRDKDIYELGGRDERSFRNAFEIMFQIVFAKLAFKDLGLVLPDKLVENRVKNMFSKDGKFNQSTLKEYLDKNNISQNGLIRLVEHSLRLEQLFFPTKYLEVPDHFVDNLYQGLNKSRNGYYLEVDLSFIDLEKLLTESQVKTHEIFDFCVDNPDMANQVCYVFYTGETYNSTDTLEVLKTKYKFEQGSFENNKIRLYKTSNEINFNIQSVNKNTFCSEVFENEYGKYFVYYNPIPALWKTKFSSSLKFKDFLARKILFSVQNQFKDESFVKNYSFGENKMKYVENISFKNFFQHKTGTEDKYKINDCVCQECFNPNNPLGLTRPVAISLLLGKLNQPYGYIKAGKMYISIPVSEAILEVTPKSEIKSIVNEHARKTCTVCATVASQDSAISIV